MRLSRWLLFLPCFAVLAAGCAQDESEVSEPDPIDIRVEEQDQPPTQPEETETQDPAKALQDQVRMGTVQLSSAIDTVRAALIDAETAAETAEGMTAEAADEISFFLDSAGNALAQADAAAPDSVTQDSLSEAESAVAEMQPLVRDALQDLENALGIAESLAEGGPDSAMFSSLTSLILLAIEDVESALETIAGDSRAA